MLFCTHVFVTVVRKLSMDKYRNAKEGKHGIKSSSFCYGTADSPARLISHLLNLVRSRNAMI